jgi:protein-disulfide isomerase
MFQNQRALAIDDLKKAAAGLGLDAAKFDACLDTGKTAATVQRDMQEGGAAGVGSTPSMFINGRFLEGTQQLDQLSAIVDDELRRLGK